MFQYLKYIFNFCRNFQILNYICSPKQADKYTIKVRKVKYIYDYPDNRTIGKDLSCSDFNLIAKKTGFSYDFVYRVLALGIRNNDKIKQTAKRLICLHNKL